MAMKRRRKIVRRRTKRAATQARSTKKKSVKSGRSRQKSRAREARKSHTIYRRVYSKRNRRHYLLVRSKVVRRSTTGLGSISKRRDAASRITRDLKKWHKTRRGYKGRRARANIELRVKVQGKTLSKWISFKRRVLTDENMERIENRIQEMIKSYLDQGMRVTGFRDLEFETVRPAPRAKRENPKAQRKKITAKKTRKVRRL